MRNLILLIIVIFIFPRCAPESKPNTNCRNYTKISHIMGDSNLVVDLPNLIESESNYCISDIEDVGIYKRFVLECKSLIGKDTVITKIESSFDSVERTLSDSIMMRQITIHDVEVFTALSNIVFEELKVVNGRKLYFVKYIYDKKPCYKIIYLSKYQAAKVDIYKITDEKAVYDILNSLRREQRRFWL